MNKLFKILLLAVLFLPTLVFAQNQGDVLGLGQGGTRILCRVNTNGAAIADDTDANYIACDTAGRIILTSDSTSYNFSMLEDAAYADGRRGVPVFGIRADSSSNYTDTNGDAIPFALSGQGNLRVNVTKIGQIANADDLLKVEDVAASAGGAGVAIFYAAQDPLTQDQDTTNDNAQPKTDRAGRTVTTGAPSGELVVGCNTAITTATTGSMISAVASKFTFITSWDCTNTGGTASRVILEDGDGTDLANDFLAATTGRSSGTFPTPAKTNVVNKAIQINVITSGSSTICCARGYTGVI